MLGLDRHAARYTWTVIFILLLAVFAYLIRETLFVFVVALLFSYLLWPVVKFLDRRLPSRSKVWALGIVYLSMVAILVAIGIGVGSQIVAQANALSAKVPELLSNIAQPPAPVSTSSIQSLRSTIMSAVRKQVTDHSQDIVSLLRNAAIGVLSRAGSLIFIVLVPILSFFFLKDGDVIRSSILDAVAWGRQRENINDIVIALNVLFAQYMRALLLLATTAFVAYALFFSVIGVPYGILLAAVAFPLEFIPLVGPLTGAVITLTVAGLSGFHHWIWIVAFLAAFRIFQDYVLAPHLLSEGMELHPVLVIFGVLAGGSVAGVAGSFISVPLLAALRVIFLQLQRSSSASSAHTPNIETNQQTPTSVQKIKL